MPKISVITVCRNEAATIRKTLDSIVCQTFRDYELIVVDGGSTDGTKEIIEEYASKIDWWISEPDGGIYNAMNKGVAHACGDYVIFMNGGDCFHAATTMQDVVDRGMTADIIEGYALNGVSHSRLREPSADIVDRLLTDGISHQSTFTRRELLERNHFDERYKIVADWKLWLQTLVRDRNTYQFVGVDVADIDMTGVTYSQFRQNLQERDQVLAELAADPSIGHMAVMMREYNYLTHNTLVQYAVWLDRHSPRGYSLVRKIAKRVVRWCKRKQSSEKVF